MSNKDRIIEIELPKEDQIRSVEELTDFIENELKPPSRLRWLIIYFIMGSMGGFGLGALLSWVWTK
jgi:NhaP-type Na+/H+ or K+/H+ antiporter